MVDASMPVDSAIRRAARPVGATSTIDAFCAAAAAQISRIVAVLPVPGPPVTIESREANAARTACHCSGAGTRSSCAARAGAARTGSALGQVPYLLGKLRLERRGLRPVAPDRLRAVDLEHQLAGVRHLAAAATRTAAARRAAPACAASSATGRQVDPSFSASASTCSTPARVRAGESGAMSPARAIRSAVWKPTRTRS